MNIKDVPQDYQGIMEAGKIRDVCYATDDNGKYTTELSLGWNPKYEAMHQAWDFVKEQTEQIKAEVLKGKLSPIAYYMQKNVMDHTTLAQYMGLWKWRVKRHCKMSVFKKLDNTILEKYAQVFGITVDQLKNIA